MSNENIRYCGRIDRSKKYAPVFYYAGSYAEINFMGTGISVTLTNHTVWGDVSLGFILDGKMGKLPLSEEYNDQQLTVPIAEGLESGVHKLIIYKAHGANHFYSLKGIDIISGVILPPSDLGDHLKLEVFGDSVCAGEVCEAIEYVGRADPEDHNSAYDNAWYSFVMQASRMLNAEIHNIAQGGIAVFSNTGYFHMPNTIGMEAVYDKLCYFPEAGPITKWDFTQYTPDIVIIALGQNDNHNSIGNVNDLDINDPPYRYRWKGGYKNIVMRLAENYGKDHVKFVLTTTILRHDPAWDEAIEEICGELSADGYMVWHNVFTRNGNATDGHPRITEHTEMANELVAFIKDNVL